MIFKLEKVYLNLKNFLFISNKKYEYKLDINQLQSYILCSAYNSRINRDIKTTNKKKENDDYSLLFEDIFQPPIS